VTPNFLLLAACYIARNLKATSYIALCPPLLAADRGGVGIAIDSVRSRDHSSAIFDNITLLFFFGASSSMPARLAGAPGIVVVVLVAVAFNPKPTLDPDSDASSAPFSSPLALGVGSPISIELVLLAPLIPMPIPVDGGTNMGGMDDCCGGGGILTVVMDEAADPSLSCRLANEAETAGEGGTGVEETDVCGCPEWD
jgi:hypothetical protein